MKTLNCNSQFESMNRVFRNRTTRLTMVWLSLGALALVASPSFASETYSGYDSIVKELSTTQTDLSDTTETIDPLNSVKFHGSFGLVSSQLFLDLPGVLPRSKSFHGYEASFGIDLLSKNWEAVGSVRSFDPEKHQQTELSLREFDLLIFYKSRFARAAEFRLGGGMTSRYLDLNGAVPSTISSSYTTPSLVFATGLQIFFSSSISLGPNLTYRDPLISDTIDNGSWDGSLQLSGHF